MKIKPGYRTSEFWFTLVSFLFSGLYLVGIINDSGQKEDLIRDVSHGVESVILIGGQLAILWKYISSRKEIKQTNIVAEEENKKDDSNQRSKSNESKRVTKAKSRKPSTRKPKGPKRS